MKTAKKYLLLIVSLLFPFSSFCQNDNGGSVRVNWDYVFFIRTIHGISFHSFESYRDIQAVRQKESEKNCDTIETTFAINGLPISENDFIQLKLRAREVDSEKSYYTEEYENGCICRINYYAYLKIPIWINGVDYDDGDILPIEKLEGKELLFKKEKRFLKKNRIVVSWNHRLSYEEIP